MPEPPAAACCELQLPVHGPTQPPRCRALPQKKALENEVASRAEAELRSVLTSADAADALRLLLNDAGTGAVNGSVVLP